MKRWASGDLFTLRELRFLWSLRRAGCRDNLPLLGMWVDDGGTWRVRCRLCDSKARARRRLS